MSAHTVLTCDTLTDGHRCTRTTTVYHTCIVSFARELAAHDGWFTEKTPQTGEPRDLCPDCAPRSTVPDRLIPGRNCPPGSPCHLLGHDAVGHRITNLLAHHRLTLEAACALRNDQLAGIDGLGPGTVNRIRHRTRGRLPAPPRTDTGTQPR